MSDTSRKSGENSRRRGPGRPFQRGNVGKPKGALARVTRAAQALLDGESETLTRAAIDLAKAGDGVALRICMERLLPPRKDRPVSFDLPKIEKLEDASKALAGLLEGVATGEITPGEAAGVVPLVEGFIRAIKATEFEKRLTALEQAGDRS